MKLKYIISLAASAAVFTSCEKDKIEGPNLNDMYGELTIIESLNVIVASPLISVKVISPRLK